MALTLSTRRAFSSFLSNECQGITTFFDDRELEEGTSIPLELPSAIKESNIATFFSCQTMLLPNGTWTNSQPFCNAWKAGTQFCRSFMRQIHLTLKINWISGRELINDIVKCVCRKVQATFTLSDSSWKLVGTDDALEQLSLLLPQYANDVRFIGITRMGE
ncbi:TMV resistance protein N-like [Pyrus ussuriensis x Pyrus communis]|uniref:TMV resistance protein N-like n=1 Tax=Pyrus ussuriensis x Pyrus communis TaxID=2448454 RepID=A0A5N5FFM2_9ROSA|nr:TMV resistance protein N-like [Pyrus ussuriensis x Pyrus communis]